MLKVPITLFVSEHGDGGVEDCEGGGEVPPPHQLLGALHQQPGLRLRRGQGGGLLVPAQHPLYLYVETSAVKLVSQSSLMTFLLATEFHVYCLA